ncbi:iron complex transport system permease protein [Actinopolyspora mzabensis]|uniref:Iron complex transport system permease protein n=1 Tax=Actinopolyspora mzabensis TaxID=995066 RepID=A0A1G9B0S4_ACTMZ|nr:iron ABC transporter permease [Actinopolyspora mzabensis]SDK32724.1 iron complex transport system permease protein [Actinopolyspora mzabensis]
MSRSSATGDPSGSGPASPASPASDDEYPAADPPPEDPPTSTGHASAPHPDRANRTTVSKGSNRLNSRRRGRLLGVVVLCCLLLLSCALSILIGAKLIPPGAVLDALFAGSRTENNVIIYELRVPRTIAGVLAGSSLGLAGALMQGYTRNPIAAPSVLGITQGAGLAVVLAVFTMGISGMLGFIWFSFAGALISALAVFLIGSIGKGGATPVALALAGAAISALLQALTSALVLLDRQSLDTYRFWKVGSIAVSDMGLIQRVLPFLLLGLVLGLASAPGLNALSLGDDMAAALGHNVARSRALGITAIAVLVGSAVAMCGPISFVGLVVPHIARYFAGPDHRWLLPFAALGGACLVLLADLVGRVMARPSEIQVGVMLAMIGAPFFIALVRRRRLMRL